MYKYTEHVGRLEAEIKGMCGVGTRYVKLFLNTKAKKADEMASFLRNILECETLNINAKRYRNTVDHNYRESYYNQKNDAINQLVRSLFENNPCKIKFGYQKSDTPPARHIVYFYHSSFGQISFHCSITARLPEVYDVSWDGIEDSTLYKLEACIDRMYGEEIREKYKNKTTQHKIDSSKSRIRIGNDYITRSALATGNFDEVLESDVLSSIPKLQDAQKKLLTKWVIHKLSFNTAKFSTFEECRDALYAQMRENEKLSDLIRFISDAELLLIYKDLSNDELIRLRNMADFANISEKDREVLKSIIPHIRQKDRNRLMINYAKYITSKFKIKVDISDLLDGKKVGKQKRKKIKKIEEERALRKAIEYLKEHKEFDEYGLFSKTC